MPSQNNNPWGNNPQSSPPDLDQLIAQGLKQLKGFLSGGGANSGNNSSGSGNTGAGGVLTIVSMLIVAMSGWSAYYTVPSDSVAVVQRFGKYLSEVPPGLHFKLPLGIDKATIVPVKRQLKQEFGFKTAGARDPYQSSSSHDGIRETQMVTGDLNAALVEWVVQYRISEPVKFLFEVREPSETLRYVSESVMIEVVGDRTVDEVLTMN